MLLPSRDNSGMRHGASFSEMAHSNFRDDLSSTFCLAEDVAIDDLITSLVCTHFYGQAFFVTVAIRILLITSLKKIIIQVFTHAHCVF